MDEILSEAKSDQAQISTKSVEHTSDTGTGGFLNTLNQNQNVLSGLWSLDLTQDSGVQFSVH